MTMQLRLFLAGAFLAGSLPLLREDVTARRAIKTTVCGLVSAPTKFDNALVTLNARVQSDGTHGAELVEKACFGEGIALEFDSSSDQQSADSFQTAVFAGVPGTTDKEVKASFVGTFHWKQGRAPSRVLTVRQISNIRVKKMATPSRR